MTLKWNIYRSQLRHLLASWKCCHECKWRAYLSSCRGKCKDNMAKPYLIQFSFTFRRFRSAKASGFCQFLSGWRGNNATKIKHKRGHVKLKCHFAVNSGRIPHHRWKAIKIVDEKCFDIKIINILTFASHTFSFHIFLAFHVQWSRNEMEFMLSALVYDVNIVR